MPDAILISAGEASGDLHAGRLIQAARKIRPGLRFYGAGGPRMQAAGAELLFDLDDMSMMGLTEVFSGLGKAYQLYRTMKNRLAADRPKCLVLVDYPEINIPLAKAARRVGVPVFYYACPQVWAWRVGRVHKMGRYADRRVVLFPFEVDFYRRYGYHADFVGHPLLDALGPPRPGPEVKAELGLDPNRPLLLLMPGSRRRLVRAMTPHMLAAVRILRRRHPGLQVALAKADHIPDALIDAHLRNGPPAVSVITGQNDRLQNAADAALVSSGTAVLETALMLTPLTVVYRMHTPTYLAARAIVRTPFVSAPNLIAGRRVVEERLQSQARPATMADDIHRLLTDDAARKRMINDLSDVRRRLGSPGAADRAAYLLMETAGLSPNG